MQDFSSPSNFTSPLNPLSPFSPISPYSIWDDDETQAIVEQPLRESGNQGKPYFVQGLMVVFIAIVLCVAFLGLLGPCFSCGKTKRWK